MSGFFHGVTVTNVDTGSRPIAVPSSSIIGLCDTFTPGPNASALPNQLMLITRESEAIAAWGADAAITKAIQAIYVRSKAVIVACGVAKLADAAAQTSAIIGGVLANGSRTGMQALLDGKSRFNAQPRLLVAPKHTATLPAATALVALSDKLRAIAIIDGPNTTDEAAMEYRENFGSKRVFLVDPGVQYWDTAASATIDAPGSAWVAGLFAWTDSEYGFWASPSNKEFVGITGTRRPIEFLDGDETCRANLLNNAQIATIIRDDGYRLWGNRTCSADPKWAFVTRVRTMDIVMDAILYGHTIGDTIRLRDEWKKAHDTGAASADGLLRKLESNLKTLKEQGIEVGKLRKEYQALGQVARGAELKALGHTQIQQGKEGMKNSLGKAAALTASLAIPTKVSGDYQAQIRQMSLWAHTAGTGDEAKLAASISKVAADKGMSQQLLAKSVGALIEKGVEWDVATSYAGQIADLIDGQGMEPETIATLINSFKEAGVKQGDMAAMLGQVAAAGDIGAFGPKEMAKYLPAMLGNIKRLGMEGPEAVRFLGASLQSQYSQTQDSAAAATNMNNLLNAVISSTSQERFAKEGYDLAGSILAATKSGKAANPVDAFIMLSEQLIRKQDPAKAKKIEALKAKIKASADGSAEEEQAMVALTEAAGLANIVSDQSASAGLLAQIKYGDKIKADMATIEKTDGKAKIEADAAKARETSNRKWATATAGIESSMTSIGDAVRPLTDLAADGLAKVAYGLGELAGKFPTVISGATVLAGGIVALGTAMSAYKMGKGMLNVARGSLMGNPNVIQRVFVTNPSGSSGGADGGDGKRRRGKGKRGRGSRGPAGSPVPAAPIEAVASKFSPKTMMGKGAGFAKGAAPLALIEAGLIAADTYQNAQTRDEKAEGYGTAAGTLAGTLAGAAAGAAIGSVVPVIGTVVGGLIGGFLGSWGGGELGGAVSKAAFGGPDTPIERLAQPSPLLLSKPSGPGMSRLAQLAPTPATGPLVGDVARSLASVPSAAAVPALLSAGAAAKPEPARVEQAWTFAPTMPVTVQGDVKDPRQLAQEMMPHMRQLFEEFSREQARRNLFDAPHI